MFVYSDRDRDTPTRDCVVVSSWADVQCWRRECEPMLLPAASGATGRPCALSRPVRTCLPPIPVRPRGRGRAAPAAAARAEGTLGACVPVEVTAFGFSLDFVDRVRFELFQNAGNRIKRDAQDSLAQESARRELPATRRPQPAWVSRRGKVASSPGRRAVPRRPAARSSGNTMY